MQATPAATQLSHPGRGRLAYRGQAVGPAGQPAANLYVYVGVPGARGFEPAGWSIGRTDSRGRFSLDCPHAPILLSPWPIMGEAKTKARNVQWSAACAPLTSYYGIPRRMAPPGSTTSGDSTATITGRSMARDRLI